MDRTSGLHMKCLLVAALFFTASLFDFFGQVHGATTLTNCNEASLRAALAAGGTIQFNCNAIIVVTQALTVTQDTTLDANGRTVFFNGMGSSSILRVQDRKSTRLNSSHLVISYAVFCLKKK